jgi:alkanesulfonate monooxygenase SsuD/methylene tetrahydromethanopterin reductase-like flavin-dependent oxidoreductase (luciferase family)
VSEVPPVRGHRGLGLFLEPRSAADVHAAYRTDIRRVVEAESLGFDTAWVATRHFGSLGAGLPSALPFLGALAQATERIRVGTAVIPISFEHPIRIAEDAAIVDHLSGGRLELGVGKGLPAGLSTQSFHAFGLEEGDRDGIYVRALDGLRSALGGQIHAGDAVVALYPPGRSLLRRIWQATSRVETAAAIGRAGDGLQLNRTAVGGDPGEVQSRLIDAYLDAFDGPGEPRIGISRVVLPAPDRASAIALYASDLADGQASADAETQLVQQHAAFGTVDDILDRLGRDQAFQRSTDYLFHVPIGAHRDEYGESLRVIADEIYPGAPVARGELLRGSAS